MPYACEPALLHERPSPVSVLLAALIVLPSLMETAGEPPCRDCPQCRATPVRPYLRSSLARSVYSKIQADEEFENFDKSEWYQVDLDRIPMGRHQGNTTRDLFVQLDSQDADTVEFLDRCRERSDAVFTQLFHLAARTLLAPFICQTSVNGLLRRGSMFVVSGRQFRQLFRLHDAFHAGRMLDLGAGDGATTALLAPMFDQVFVTEMSWPMKRILTSRGFTVKDVDDWSKGEKYDVICALNLLDRCSRPLTLLDDVSKSLKPGGLFLLALVWPFRPYVEFASNHQPEEMLPISGASFEAQAASLMSDVLQPRGFRIVSWSRVPYLCEGDLERTFYHLPDMVVALTLHD